MGLIAQPEMPPTRLESTGLAARASISMPGTVLMAVMACAPASSAASAMRAMLGTLEDNFTLKGIEVFSLTLRVTAAVVSGDPEKGVPKSSLTFGQEILTSIRSGSASEMPAAMRPNSSTVGAKMLAINGTPNSRSRAFASRKMGTSSFKPGLVRPTALITPPAHPTEMGLACPARGSGPQLLAVTAPAPQAATRSSKPGLVPSTPEASTSGLRKFKPKNVQERSLIQICAHRAIRLRIDQCSLL